MTKRRHYRDAMGRPRWQSQPESGYYAIIGTFKIPGLPEKHAAVVFVPEHPEFFQIETLSDHPTKVRVFTLEQAKQTLNWMETEIFPQDPDYVPEQMEWEIVSWHGKLPGQVDFKPTSH